MGNKEVKRIGLWSGPRNISTALMYSFAQRADTKVFDEPLYAYYLKQSNAKDYHPGASEILATMENDGTKVVEMMCNYDEKPVLFFKNMTHHLLDLDRSFMENMINVILTRDPVEMLPSFDAVIPNPSVKDVGYESHMKLVKELQSKDLPVLIFDSKSILLDPKKELTRLCEAIGIDFDEKMLQWTAGPLPEDGIWAEYWYKNVHLSTSFQKYQIKDDPFPDHLKPLLKECKSYYDQLMEIGEN